MSDRDHLCPYCHVRQIAPVSRECASSVCHEPFSGPHHGVHYKNPVSKPGDRRAEIRAKQRQLQKLIHTPEKPMTNGMFPVRPKAATLAGSVTTRFRRHQVLALSLLDALQAAIPPLLDGPGWRCEEAQD